MSARHSLYVSETTFRSFHPVVCITFSTLTCLLNYEVSSIDLPQRRSEAEGGVLCHMSLILIRWSLGADAKTITSSALVSIR